MTPKQEEALRDYLQEVIVPLIEEVLVKKLGQAMTFAKKELAEQPAQQEPVGMVKDLFTNAAWGKLDVLGSTKVYLNVAPQPAQRKPLTTQEIREWWASENGLEDCEMSKLDDFEKVVRAIEAAHGITSGAATLGEKK